MDWLSPFRYGSCKQAMNDAGIAEGVYYPQRMGVAIGSGIGGITNIEDTVMLVSERGLKSYAVLCASSIINMISGILSNEFNLQGPNLAVATACTAGTHCINWLHAPLLTEMQTLWWRVVQKNRFQRPVLPVSVPPGRCQVAAIIQRGQSALGCRPRWLCAQ